MDIRKIVGEQRRFFLRGRTLDLAFRLQSLNSLKKYLEVSDQAVFQALKLDLGKSEAEAYLTEYSIVMEELDKTIRQLPKWVKDKKVSTPLVLQPAKSFIVHEPYGVALVMAPWNYPFHLSMLPLVGAVAAGNCVVLKPSAYAPHTSSLLAEVVKNVFDPQHVTVVEGGRKENTDLLDQRFDNIFFTGSTNVGKVVMEAASRHLTPVTLELGGKSPVIVDDTADLNLAAKRIVFGKFINAGQTCVAPDHVLVHGSVRNELVERISYWIRRYYPMKEEGTIPNYPSMVNEKHFDRVVGLMEEEKIVIGGSHNVDRLFIEPTVMVDVDFSSPVMGEEIFGPVLPVIAYDKLADVIQLMAHQPKPLALYLFSKSKKVQRKILWRVSFGGGCINDTVVHLVNPNLGFGGVGDSGMGTYHGKHTFDVFTHEKSIVSKGGFLDFSLRYRPYTKGKMFFLKKFRG